jgi:hypothetical protein
MMNDNTSDFKFACKCVDNKGGVTYMMMSEVDIIEFLHSNSTGYVVVL